MSLEIDGITGEILTRKGPFLRQPGNYDADQVSRETALDCSGDPGFTQQQFAEETDINTIVKRFNLTGELPDDQRRPLPVQDFSGPQDYREQLTNVRRMQEGFYDLPASVRARFEHDPSKMLEFLERPTNRAEAIELGLIDKPVESTPQPQAAPPDKPV